MLNFAELSREDKGKLDKLVAQLKEAVYRIDGARRWDPEQLEMEPVEVRDLWALERGEFQVHLPAGCVALACLDELEG